MKKYLIPILALTCMNAFAQQPALDPEKQKRIQEFLAKEIPKMPDPIARIEAEHQEKLKQKKAREEYRKHMESEEVKRKIAQMDMFEKMMKQYNNMDESAKTAYRENIFKKAFALFDAMKKAEPDNEAVMTPSGNSSKLILTYEDKADKQPSEYEINQLTEQFSRFICESPQFLVVLGMDTQIEGVFNSNGKLMEKVNMTKKDCKYIDFKVK